MKSTTFKKDHSEDAFSALTDIRRTVSMDPIPPVDGIVDSGIMPYIVYYLKSAHTHS